MHTIIDREYYLLDRLHNILLFSILTTVISIILRFNAEAIVIGNRNYTTRTFRLQMIFCNLN